MYAISEKQNQDICRHRFPEVYHLLVDGVFIAYVVSIKGIGARQKRSMIELVSSRVGTLMVCCNIAVSSVFTQANQRHATLVLVRERNAGCSTRVACLHYQ
jgi:hypothetical protein